MTFTIFVSISLLALVVSARPYPLADPEHGDGKNAQLDAGGLKTSAGTTKSLRDAVQAVFQSRTGQPLPGLPSSLSDTDIRVHLTSPSVLTSHLAALEGLDAVKAVLPLPFSALAGDAGQGIGADGAELSELTAEEKQLYELLRNSPAANGSLEDIDGGVRPVPELAHLQTSDSDASEHTLAVADDDSQQSPVADTPTVDSSAPVSAPPSPALVVLAVSALASLLVVACVSLSVYTISYFRKHVLRRAIAWDIVPRIEEGSVAAVQGADANDDEGSTSNGGQGEATCEKVIVEKVQDLIDFEGPVAAAARPEDDKSLPHEYNEKSGLVETGEDEVRSTTDGEDELNEKASFYDATDSPLLFVHDALPSPRQDPRIVVEEYPDPRPPAPPVRDIVS
ncbi:hypothetical protein EVJ58_g11092, partial [Rhodofomes roseus]